METVTPGRSLDRLQRWMLGASFVLLAACGVGLLWTPTQFFRSWLVAWLFWLAITLGSAAAVMLHHLADGAWGRAARPVFESAMLTLPLVAFLFVPLLFGLERLYPWIRDPVQEKAPYLNVPFFLVRTAVYFAVWFALVRLLDRRHLLVSAPGLVLYGLTITFASIDWVMSLEPHWTSTIIGLHFIAGQGLSSFAAALVALAFLARARLLPIEVNASHFRALGNLLLMFVLLWAYLSYSQLLIIWSGNLPEEISWYLRRAGPSWRWVALALVGLHFAIPFFVLLSRRVKEQAGWLAVVAAVLLLARAVDIFWLVVPAFQPDRPVIHGLDVLALLGMGALWIALFLRHLKGRLAYARS
ncbi:MAG: hypothetical protein HYY16_03480 [Planctomycetes bacterium]|nr:hypothetical protein [Planctomycetota bacterium]